MYEELIDEKANYSKLKTWKMQIDKNKN